MLTLPVGQKRLTNVAQVKYKAGKDMFVLACYRNKVIAWRLGQESDINEVLQIDDIFINVNRGEVAREKDLAKAFKGMNHTQRIKMILDNGVLQVTDDERDQLNAEMYKQIAGFVADRVLEATTGTKMSQDSIEDELKARGFPVNWTVPAKRQGLKAISLLETAKEGNSYIIRAWYQVSITFGPGQPPPSAIIVDFKHPLNVKLIHLESLGKAKSFEPSDVTNSLKLKIHPSHYGVLCQTLSKTDPEANVSVLTSDVNPMDRIPSTSGDMQVQANPSDPLTGGNASASLFNDAPLFPSIPSASDAPGGAETEENDEFRRCHVCAEVDVSNAEFRGPNAKQGYRGHMRSEWHNFNVSRQNAGQDGVDRDLYEAVMDTMEDDESD